MESRWASLGLLVVGVGLLVNPLVPGVHLGSGTVYEYSAVSVEYANGTGLELRGVEDGREKEPLAVDDEIVCEDRDDRWTCGAAYFVRQNGTVPSYAGAGFDFDGGPRLVYLGDRLYRTTTVDRGEAAHLALTPVNDSDPLRQVASTDLTARERRVVESGRVVTYRRLPRANQLLQFDGGYYFVQQTARKEYGGTSAGCVYSGGNFCSDADWKRRTDTGVTLLSRVVGLVLTFRGWERIRH
ncbi:hypothetical protein [Halorussus sp. AFM4]|uniref:hypothetical protein n=1 Tax=Halorussus sp. AFM4 TaxID=3421651 RepID=UPI003EC05287